jgi:hypothetical protein
LQYAWIFSLFVIAILATTKERSIRQKARDLRAPFYLQRSLQKCSVYGYNGKYIEDDFETLLKKEEPKSLGIPITRK